jgi:hypothetical protein
MAESDIHSPMKIMTQQKYMDQFHLPEISEEVLAVQANVKLTGIKIHGTHLPDVPITSIMQLGKISQLLASPQEI